MGGFMNFFYAIKDGAFGIDGSIAYIINFVKNMWASEAVATVKDWFFGLIAPIWVAVPFILLGFYVLLALAGKRLFGILRFLTFFVVGVLLGTYLLSPLVAKVIPQIPPFITGILTGIVAAVLSKILYIVALIVAVGYPVYTACITGTVIPAVTVYAMGNVWISLAAAAVAVLLVLLLKKFVEMLGTSMLGGLGIAFVVRGWYDFTTLELFGGKTWIPMLIVTSLVGLIGFIVQFRTRRRF